MQLLEKHRSSVSFSIQIQTEIVVEERGNIFHLVGWLEIFDSAHYDTMYNAYRISKIPFQIEYSILTGFSVE